MQASRIIAAAEVVENVTNWLQPDQQAPATESHARPLAKLPAEQQPAAWEKAQEIAYSLSA